MDDDYDVDAAVARTLLPWKCRLKLGGKWWATRCPTIGQLGALVALAGDKSPASESATIELVGQLFEDPHGALNAMILPAFPESAKRIINYAKEYLAKNSPAAAGQPAAAEAAQGETSKSGNSSPQS